MNKNDLIDAVAERTALAKSDAARAASNQCHFPC